MATARTDDGIEVEWTSTSVGTDALDAALNRAKQKDYIDARSGAVKSAVASKLHLRPVQVLAF